MRLTDIPEINRLSVPEKILLVEDPWDSIAEDESSVPVPASHMEELDKRIHAYEFRSRATYLSLEELRSRIERRK